MGSVSETDSGDCDRQAGLNRRSPKVIKKVGRISFFFQEKPLRYQYKIYLTTVVFFLTNAF